MSRFSALNFKGQCYKGSYCAPPVRYGTVSLVLEPSHRPHLSLGKILSTNLAPLLWSKISSDIQPTFRLRAGRSPTFSTSSLEAAPPTPSLS